MGKVVAKVGMIVGAVALVATGIGAIAMPGIVGTLTIGGIKASTLLLAGAGLQALGTALTPQPKLSASTTDRLNASLVTDTARKIAFGRTALNTDLRYQEWWGNDQEYCSQVFVLASHWCESVEELYLDDKLAWTAAGGVTAPFAGYLVVGVHAQAGPGSVFNAGWSRRWGANATFSGCATLYLQFKVTGNGKKGKSPFTTQITSRVTVVGKGARLPDPRFDSTVGGSGNVRVADQTTWAWAPAGHEAGRNPALALLFYLLGWRIQNPATGEWKLAVGCGVPVDRIDLGSFMTAANMCDEPVLRANGTYEPRYRCDGTFSAADEPTDVFASLEACMNAKLRDSAGRFTLQVLHNDLATPVVDFTDDDVLGDFTWTAGNDLNDRRNVVRGRLTDPSALYQLIDFPAVRIPSLDGIERIDSVDFALVQSQSQAQRLAKQRLQRTQYQGAFAAEFNARGWAVKDGDPVTLTFSALGFNKKKFRVAEGLVDPTGVVPLVLVEENEAIYAWDRGESASVQAAEPNRFDPLLLPIIAAIDEAGATADWPAITGEGKPDDYATNSGDPNSPFGPGTVKEVLAQLDRIEPIEAQFGPITSDISALQQAQLGHDDALAQLADVTADQGAAQRQITRDVGRIDEAVLRALMESARTRDVLRDAGIVVDPATGQVRIYAIDQLRDRTSTAEIAIDAVRGVVSTKASVNQVQELIAQAVLDPSQVAELEPIIARLTSAESEIDGLNAAVALKASLVEVTAIGGRTSDVEQSLNALAGVVESKASTTVVDGLGIRLGSAEQMLSALPDVSGYSVTVRQARVAADDAAEAALRGMLAGDVASRYQLSQIAEARQELTTKLVDGFTAEAIARTALTVQIGQIRASVLSEAQASVTRDSLLTERIDAQGGVLDNQAAAIGRLDRVSLDNAGGIASAQMTIRQQIGAADSSDEALLRALVAGDQADRARIAQAVQIQTEFTTTLVENERAAAVARQALLARMNAADAAIVTTARVAAEANQATAQRVSALEVAFNDASTGLLATRARIVALEEATAARNAAFAQQLELIEATVGGQGDGLAAISATVAQDRQARVDGDAANASAVEQVRTQVNDPQTGLPATAAGLAQERTARTQGDAANAQEIQTISAALYDPQTGLPATRAIVASDRQARIDGDSANATAIQQARAIIDGVGGVGVEQAFSAVATRLGKVEGRYTVTIDANGNLSGFQLIGSDAGPASFNLINTDLRMGSGRVIFNNGTYMQVQGVAFGANGDLLEWFGPTMAITSCTRANAISYKTITGDAYFGGSLSAGVLKNAVRSSLTTANASLELGPFGTTGKPKSVVASYSYSLRRRVNPPGGSITGTPSATLVLERRRGNDGAWVQLQTGTITGETTYDAPEGNTPGLGTQTMAGAITITDNSEGAQDFSYRLTLVSRTLATFNFSSPNDGPAGEPIQSLSLVSVEQ